MKQSKSSLFALCIVCAFLIVYGTAVVLRLVLGEYLIAGGLANLSYVLLTLLCAIPFLLYLSLSKTHFRKIKEVIFTSGLFFLVLFVYSNFILVLALTENSSAIAIRLLIIFPTVALILVAFLHFTLSENSWWKEIT